MNKGKDICKELKAVRKRIAEENGIALDIPECTFQGPCKGTCPRCESEVRFLENALAQRLRMGKVATVAGLALGLAVSSGVKAQSTDTLLRQPMAGTSPDLGEERNGMCEVTGVVVDGRTREAVPFVTVMLYKDTARAQVASTDFDGRYHFSVPTGHYTLVAKCIGYAEYRREVDIKGPTADQGTLELAAGASTRDTISMDTIRLNNNAEWTQGLVAVTYVVYGNVVDERTAVPIPFVNVVVRKDGKLVKYVTTDFDGMFKLDDMDEGKYDLEILSFGYSRQIIPVKIPDDFPAEPMKTIKLEVDTATLLDGMMGIMDYKIPLIDVPAPGITEGMEVQGVQVKVQY